LPFTYKETRHLRHYFAVKALLRSEINKADYLLFSPHAKYDWPTLAAELAVKLKRKYVVESDGDHRSVGRLLLRSMPFGPRKLKGDLDAFVLQARGLVLCPFGPRIAAGAGCL
jgi:hypothetical protein